MAKSNSARPAKTRVLIIEDHPIVRERLAELIGNEVDLELCGQADDAWQGIELIEATRPQLVITGLSLPHSHGLGFIKDLHARFPRVRVLVFSMYDEFLYAERAIRAGALGFVHKRAATGELLRAVRQVLGGEIYLSDKVAGASIRRFFGRSSIRTRSPLEQLSDRELEVLRLIGQGRSTRQIAAALNVDVKTVETYRARIKVKLKLATAAELVRQAQRWMQYAHA
ncbi:MAG TPA: response regulator transcription factor [Chthoniobacterales bacterium]|jgi:DNA-binding NarL/FixJ family response regulator